MNSWPSFYIPPIESDLPSLTLKTTSGVRSLEKKSDFSMYVCGITPYDATHLGHAATYLAFDLIHRYRKIQGASVSFVENITDIDEPLLERATRDSVDWRTLASDQIDLYRSDMTALHVLPPQDFVPATSVMDLIDDAITVMDRNGFVYQLDGDLYFDITTFLSDLPLSLPEAITAFSEKGGDPERLGKKHPLDPILWLSHRDGEPGWESSHGFGRPGWHIECCVIALRYLLGEHYLESTGTGPAIDLQGGGSDLVFPHHFMSAAQGAALLGRPFAKDYVHSGMVGLDGEKMSKSKGNLVFVSTLLNDGVDPALIRYALLSDHYQSDRMWSADKLSRATEAVTKIRTALAREEVVAVQSTSQAIVNAVANNLDTPAALKALETWAQETLDGNSLVAGGAGELSRLIDALLGLAL